MIGYRGASRYLSPDFADCFAMECEALKYVRDEMGLTNVKIMIPFVRTARRGRGRDRPARPSTACGAARTTCRSIMMCELPSNAVIADAVPRALRRVLDRLQRHDPADPRPGPRLRLVAGGLRRARPGGASSCSSAAIKACKARGKYVGICGQGPSDHPDLAEWLLGQGIESMSLNPDTVVDTWLRLGKVTAAAR